MLPDTIRPRVVCVGMTALDHIWQVDALPQEGKIPAQGFRSCGGGMAATAAVAVARLGGEAVFVGRAGQDDAGQLMQAELDREGVDTRHLKLIPGGHSSVSGVIVDQAGERMIVNFRGGDLPGDPSWIPAREIASADVVLADPRWPAGAARAFEIARAAGVPTVLDGEVSEPEVFDLLLPLTDHAIFSEHSLDRYASGALSRIAAQGCTIAAVTRGAQGVDWLEAGAPGHCPVVPVEVRDTNGAGDVFHGAYALALGAGLKIAHAMSFAATAAALKCTQPGGRDGIPSRAETLTLWSKNA